MRAGRPRRGPHVRSLDDATKCYRRFISRGDRMPALVLVCDERGVGTPKGRDPRPTQSHRGNATYVLGHFKVPESYRRRDGWRPVLARRAVATAATHPFPVMSAPSTSRTRPRSHATDHTTQPTAKRTDRTRRRDSSTSPPDGPPGHAQPSTTSTGQPPPAAQPPRTTGPASRTSPATFPLAATPVP
jgi:hypothetical protein